MDDEPTQDRSTPRRPAKTPAERGVAPGPLLAVMAALIASLLIAAWLTGQWQFVFLGMFGVAAGVLPFLNRRK